MRLNSVLSSEHTCTFQFTHPGRGATPPQVPTNGHATRFNSRTPGGVRQGLADRRHALRRVSIHAPREGCDADAQVLPTRSRRFNSRTPGGVRLRRTGKGISFRRVSIHAPREGCDGHWGQMEVLEGGFNSRTPGGVRLDHRGKVPTKPSFNSRTPGGVRHTLNQGPRKQYVFQFTHPGRGATVSIVIIR